MRRDVDRTQLPGGSVWNLVDFIPDEVSAAASGRGGWTYSGPVMTGAAILGSIGYHPDLGKVVYSDSASLYDAVAGGAALGTFKSSGPFGYHRGYLFGASWLS